MSQPVKLSDELVLDARVTAKSAERSIAGQIEFWAQLGRGLEPILRGETAQALRSSEVRSVSDSLTSADTSAGRKRVSTYLKSRPFPHFETDPENPGLLVKIDANGKRTRGRFVNRVFEEVATDNA